MRELGEGRGGGGGGGFSRDGPGGRGGVGDVRLERAGVSIWSRDLWTVKGE